MALRQGEQQRYAAVNSATVAVDMVGPGAAAHTHAPPHLEYREDDFPELKSLNEK